MILKRSLLILQILPFLALNGTTCVFEHLAEKKQWLLFPAANGHGSLAADDGEQWRKTVGLFLKEQ